jgi:hypothetical protein
MEEQFRIVAVCNDRETCESSAGNLQSGFFNKSIVYRMREVQRWRNVLVLWR